MRLYSRSSRTLLQVACLSAFVGACRTSQGQHAIDSLHMCPAEPLASICDAILPGDLALSGQSVGNKSPENLLIPLEYPLSIEHLGRGKFEPDNDRKPLDSDNKSSYMVTPVPGKGFGLVATVPIARGTKILVEEPLITVAVPEMVPGFGFRIADMLTDMIAAFNLLSGEQQHEYLSLHNEQSHSTDDDTLQSRLLTIFRSNAYNTGSDRSGLFPKIARINHSCKPNSISFWNAMEKMRVIYAATDIDEGEEITVSYIPLLASTKRRNARLLQYGFACDCSACQSTESSKRREKISDLFEHLDQKAVVQDLKLQSIDKLISKATMLVDMVESEGLSDYKARAFHLLAIFYKRRGDRTAAREWATKELESHQLAAIDSEEALATVEFIEDI